MLAIYILVVYLYIGIAVGFYNYLSTPSHKQSHKQIDQEAREYWHTTYTCSKGDDK